MEVQKQEPQKEKKKSKFMKYFGRSLLTGVGFFALVYACNYCNVYEDYHKKRKFEIEEGKVENNLLVENYIATIEGERKCVTIFAEKHFYNKFEHEKAKKLLERYDEIYFESGTLEHMRSTVSKKYLIMFRTFGIFQRLSDHYMKLAQGRTYPSLSETAHSLNKPVHPLEETDLFGKTVTIPFMFNMLLNDIEMTIRGPWFYEYLKYEYTIEEFLNFQHDEKSLKYFCYERDKVMAQNIVKAIKESEKPILAGFGLLHYNGIIKNLRERENVLLEKVDSLEECKKRVESCEFNPNYKFY